MGGAGKRRSGGWPCGRLAVLLGGDLLGAAVGVGRGVYVLPGG